MENPIDFSFRTLLFLLNWLDLLAMKQDQIQQKDTQICIRCIPGMSKWKLTVIFCMFLCFLQLHTTYKIKN